MACFNGHTDCVRLLLGAGAAVDQARTDGGTTPLIMACHEGHIDCIQLLSSYGASRTLGSAADVTAEDMSLRRGHNELTAWLCLSRGWTPLHHIEVLTPERARMLLRCGADLHARPAQSAPPKSPIERALAMEEPRSAVAELLLRAAERWSPHTHDLFPAAARARAVELLWLGHQLAVQPRFAGVGQALVHAWVEYVIAHDVNRAA